MSNYENDNRMRSTRVSTGAINTFSSIGAVVACVISYDKWHSILWAIIHATLGWIYVIYYAIKY